MKLSALFAAAAFVLCGAAAHAENFDYAFSGNDGVVTGEIFGLASSGSSAPTAVEGSVGGSSLYLTLPNSGGTFGGFTVANNTITSADFTTGNSVIGDFQFNLVGVNLIDTSNSTESYNSSGFSGVTYTAISAAPEPSTWLLMFAGIGGIALMLRRAKKTMGFRFKDAFSA